MKNVIGLINLHNSPEIEPLTNSRPLASTTFLGRYSFIDFALSNFTNSGIDRVGILLKDHSRSIIKHLGSDTTYLKNPKTGWQNIFINEYGLTNPKYNTDLNNIKENDWFLYDTDAEIVVISPVSFVARIDFNKIVKDHLKSKRKVSVVCRDTTHADTRFIDCDKVTIDVLGNVQKFENNYGSVKEACISLETYVFDAKYLKELLKKLPEISGLFTLKDLVHYISNYLDVVHAIKFDGYCRYFGSLKEYRDFSFELLDTSKFSSSLFVEGWDYYTTTHNSSPTSYGLNAEVTHSLLANGCQVDGKVTHSILARNVVVEEGATVIDSIIFTNTVIKKGVTVKNCIIDKHCVIKNKELVEGSVDKPLYIPQGEKI